MRVRCRGPCNGACAVWLQKRSRVCSSGGRALSLIMSTCTLVKVPCACLLLREAVNIPAGLAIFHIRTRGCQSSLEFRDRAEARRHV